ncbi:MAG: hypothetical protein AAF004_05095 [Pseudomonadota bacterium]
MPDTTPPRRLLTDAQTNDLGHALLTLTKELWVLTDRVHTFEAVLAKHGIAVTEDIEAYEPDADETARRLAHSQRIVQSVLGALGIGISPGEAMAHESVKSSNEHDGTTS